MSGNRLSAAERRERDAARAAENNGVTTGTGGVTGKGFRPGQSGNPGGRPKGLASAVKEKVRPEDLVSVLVEVANDPRAKASERIAAVRELADRGWGKAPAFAAIEGNDPLELGPIAEEIARISEELARRDRERDELAARREGRTTGPVGPVSDSVAHG